MNLREKAIQGVFWTGVQNWGSNLATTIVLLILARLLGVRTFGLVALASVFIAFLQIFQRQGLAQAVVQRADLKSGHLNAAFWISLASGIVLTVVGVAAAGPVAFVLARWQPSPINVALLASVIQWLSLSFLIAALGNTPQAILRRNLAFKSLAMRSLASSLVGGIVGVAMALNGFGVWSLVGQRLTSALAGTITLWMACHWWPGVAVSAKHFRDLFGFGVYLMGNETVAFFNRRMPDLLIGVLLGPVALGYYTVGFRLLLIMRRLFTQSISGVALPTFSRLQHDHAQMGQALLTATSMTSLLAIPAFLGMAVLAPELVAGLIGEKWNQSVPIMQILAFIGIMQSVTSFNGPVIVACGKPSWALGLGVLNAVANVVVLTIAVHWGIVVVAAAFVIRGYACAPLPLLAVRKLIGLSITRYLRQLTAPVAGSLAMVVFVYAAKRVLTDALNLHALLVVCVVVGVLTYTLAIHLIAPGRLRQAVEYVRLALPSGSSASK